MIKNGVILAGGRGKRMGEIGEQTPKPLLPIANKPLILHHVELMASLGITRLFILVGHAAGKIMDRLGDGARFGVSITYVNQETPLGSAHALGRLANYIDGPFLAVLGDYYFHAPRLPALIDLAETGQGIAFASKHESDDRSLRDACVVNARDDGRVVSITEKPIRPTTNLKGCGIYVFPPEIFDAIRRTPRTALRDEYEITMTLELCVNSLLPVYTMDIIEWDTNLTSPADVIACNLAWLRNTGKSALIADDAQICEGAIIRRSVIGDGAVIERPVQVLESVLYGRARWREETSLVRNVIIDDIAVDCKTEKTRSA